jgi:phenylacetate-coenzyme A ligase PaaK-like adenylate-forming protein
MTTLLQESKGLQFTSKDAEAQETKLTATLQWAAKSPLYRKLWGTAGFKPTDCKGISELNSVPYLSRQCLFEATKTKPASIQAGPIGQWFLGHDRFDAHEWYPYSNEDFLVISSSLSRLASVVGLQSGDVVLAVVDTPPRISSFIPFLWNYEENSRGLGLEFINGSMEWYDALAMSWITFIQKRRPTAILATKRNAAALAEKLQTMGTSVKATLPLLRVGIFFGEGKKEQLEAYSSAESFEVYSPIEHMGFWSECRGHSGVHAWLDSCIPEVIPEGKKEAALLSKSTVGAEGELVITNFATALPLVRYRTGKRIKVESVGQCDCGANHPKIKFSP